MPFKPIPMLFHCPECHWRGVFEPKSDALVQPECEQCPVCGHQKLERKLANALEAWWVKLRTVIRL